MSDYISVRGLIYSVKEVSFLLYALDYTSLEICIPKLFTLRLMLALASACRLTCHPFMARGYVIILKTKWKSQKNKAQIWSDEFEKVPPSIQAFSTLQGVQNYELPQSYFFHVE